MFVDEWKPEITGSAAEFRALIFLSRHNERPIKLFLLTRGAETCLASVAYACRIKIYGRKKGGRKYQEFLVEHVPECRQQSNKLIQRQMVKQRSEVLMNSADVYDPVNVFAFVSRVVVTKCPRGYNPR